MAVLFRIRALWFGLAVCAAWGCGGDDDGPTHGAGDGGAAGGGSVGDGGGRLPDAGGDRDAAMPRDSGMDSAIGPEPDAAVQDAGFGAGDAEVDAGPVYDDPAGRSGTRLRRRYFDAGGGAYMTLGLWDSELELACEYDTAADGQMRCLPSVIDVVYFTDSGCASPIMAIQDGARCQPEYGRVRVGNRPIFRRTDTPAVLSSMLYYRTDSGCMGSFVPSGETYWVAEEVPSARFVRGQFEDDAREGGVVARFLEGDDGSRILFETLDQVSGSSCDLEHEPGRCMPQSRTPAHHFRDAACTQSIADVTDSSGVGLLYITQRDADSCPLQDTYYMVGGVRDVAGTRYYRNAAGMCVSQGVTAARQHRDLGAVVPLTSFPATQQAESGAGRLRARRTVDGAGAPLAYARAFWDTERDRECSPGRFPDGSYRCVPDDRGVLVDLYFADAACAETPLGIYQCSTPGAFIVDLDSAATSCDATGAQNFTAFYERGAPYEADAYYFENHLGACEARPRQPGIAYYRPGDEVASSDLPELRLELE